MKSVQVMGQVVDSLTVTDLMSVTLSRSSTYIIKTDIEDFDCEVYCRIFLDFYLFFFPPGY